VLSLKLNPELEEDIRAGKLTKEEVLVVKKIGAEANAAFSRNARKKHLSAPTAKCAIPLSPQRPSRSPSSKTWHPKTMAPFQEPNGERRFIGWDHRRARRCSLPSCFSS